ncbi:MAG TPA: NADPH-dependent FMN reductase [Amycolatopsis sp.]|nr:NADPH-dependent FMN reductase [Amycolatopsis sp.]
MRILTVCGSLRDGSTNSALLRTVAAVAPAGVEIDGFGGPAALPHFNPDDDTEPLHPAVADLRARLGAADAVLFCTPEYAGALPGSFKNLLDWCVGAETMYGKPVAWINASWAPTGAADAHASLRIVLGYLSVRIVEEACAHIPVGRTMVGDDGLIHDEVTRDRVRETLDALVKAG